MDRDNASTATQADHGMTRRGVMRRTAIGVGAAATLGATASGGAAAINLPSRDTIITAAGVAISPPLMGAKYVYDRLTDTGTGEDVNSELDALNAEETHTSIYQDGLEMGSVDDRVLTSIDNVVSGLDRRAYQKGIETAITRMDAGDSEADVETKAISDAMDLVADTQKNLIDHWSIQFAKLRRLAREASETSNLSQDIIYHYDSNGDTISGSIQTQQILRDYSLANSDVYTGESWGIDSATPSDNKFYRDLNQETIRVKPVSSGSTVVAIDLVKYRNLWSSIESIGTTVESEITSWVSGIYPSYNAGDIDLSELVTADQLAATASEQNDLSNVTADFASLGIPINNRTTLTIEIVTGENSGTIIDGNLAVRNPPTDGFIVGDTYDPANISGPVWLMYDRTTDSGEKEGDVYQIENKFKVIDAEGYDGDPVSNVTFEEKTQERYSTDIQELNAQLDKLAEYQQEIQEERDALIEEEVTSGGGGGFLEGVGQGYTLGIAAIGAGVLYLLGQN